MEIWGRGRGVRWRLWRQDDNGNRFLIAEFENREAAERRMEDLSRYPHKQMYWIEGSALPSRFWSGEAGE